MDFFSWIYDVIICHYKNYWIGQTMKNQKNPPWIVKLGIWWYKRQYESITYQSLRHIIFGQMHKINEWNYFFIFLQIMALSEIGEECIEDTIKSMKLYKIHKNNIGPKSFQIDLASFGKYILKYIIDINQYDEICKILDCTFDEFKGIKNIDQMYKPYFDWDFCIRHNVRPSDDSLFLNYSTGYSMIKNHFDWIHDKRYVFSENLKYWCIERKFGLMMEALHKSYTKFEPHLDNKTKDLYNEAISRKDYNFWCTGGHYTSGINNK